jgi:ABC-2 type transport system ATP-binding protein
VDDASGGAVVRAVELVVAYGRGRGIAAGLSGFTASFRPGITGLVGPNGAGKSTFLRAVAGLVEPRSGHVRVGDLSPASFLARHSAGFLPERPVLPGYLSAGEFLEGISGPGAPEPVPGEPDRPKPAHPEPFHATRGKGERGRAWTDGLGSLLPRSLSSLSLGQRKKVALTAALLGAPDLILLDEPTNGLDPMALEGLRSTLLAERRRGATIIVSSHHLDELQRIADALVFVDDGRVAGSWTKGRALERFGTLEALFRHVFRDESGRSE